MNKIADYEKLAASLHLTLTPVQLKVFEQDFAYFISLAEVYKSIPELETATPLIFPFALESGKLEEDEVNKEEYVNLKINTENVKDNYLVLPKVVK